MRPVFALSFLILHSLTVANVAWGQSDQVKTALGIKPKHADATEYDNPVGKDAESCTIESSAPTLKIPGWIVKDASGRLLRVFLDTIGDGQLDQWSYYRNGLEVYRDIDSNKDDKTRPFEHRWVGAAGIRWGIDRDEDGTIDQWKMISGEEVAVEVFEAVKMADAKRFVALLPTDAELASLAMGEKMTATVQASVQKARTEFPDFAKQQKQVGSDSKFVHFGATRPGLALAGNNGLEQDLVVYDHATAVYESGSELEQLSLGSLIRIGDCWRVLELPVVADAKNPSLNGGLFFPLPGVGDVNPLGPVDPNTEKLNELYGTWQKLEEQLKDARPGPATAKLQAQRTESQLQLALASSSAEDRRNWLRQMTDTALQAYQQELFDDAPRVLNEISDQLRKKELASDTDIIAWGLASAKYSRQFQSEDSEVRAKAIENFMVDLEKFIDAYPKSEFAGEAMIQLALYNEVNSSNGGEKALKLYERVVREFPGTELFQRASGAVTRLNAIGNAIAFRGQTLAGKDFDLQARSLRGKIVVLSYWATWAANVESDFEELQRLASKYKDDLVIVGVNLDNDRGAVEAFLKKNPNVSWDQLFAEGGHEKSPLAWQLGVSAPPLVVLVDEEGKVVDTTLPVSGLDREIQRLIRRRKE